MARPISEIARECKTSMLDQAQGYKRPKTLQQAFPYALPYLNAMLSLNRIEDAYGADSGRSVVLYFLSNADTWKGPKARELKAELRKLADI